jgi:hypothetical protein
MAARKASGRKKRTTRSGAARGRLSAAMGRIESELPPTLRDYSRQMRKRLDRLERDLTRAQAGMRRRAARLLREASHQLGRLEVGGEAGWRRLASPYRKRLVELMRRLEKAVAPAGARRRAPRAARRSSAPTSTVPGSTAP